MTITFGWLIPVVLFAAPFIGYWIACMVEPDSGWMPPLLPPFVFLVVSVFSAGGCGAYFF